MGLPWKIDYHIKVPAMIDLIVDSGNGPIRLSGVEGSLRLNALQSDADLSLSGTDVLGAYSDRHSQGFDSGARVAWHWRRDKNCERQAQS